MKLHHLIYRDLLTAARELDRNASFRALVSSNMLVRPVVGETKTRLPHVEEFNRDLLHFLDNRSYYMPSRDRKSVEVLVREKFRAPKSPKDAERAIDTAFVALKSLNDRLSYAMSIGIVHDRGMSTKRKPVSNLERLKKAKTKLVKELTLAQALREKAAEPPSVSSMNVRIADNVTSGVFLLAHPMLNGIFSRSVIVLTEHSKKGTKGFIVNRPTKTPLMKAFKVHPRIMRAFGSSKVRKGGPLRTEYAEILHGHSELGGERVVASNFKTASDDELFQGIDLDLAAKAVESETLKQTDVVFINGLSSWTPGQLDGEMLRGTWVAVRAPLSVAINADESLWGDLMGRLGGEYEAFSRMPEIDEGDEFDDAEDEDFDDDDDLSDFEDRHSGDDKSAH